VVVLTSTVVLTLFGRRLNALLAGDESATALGVDVDRLRAVLLVISALLTGTVIAVAGGVGFVDLLSPQRRRQVHPAPHGLPLAAARRRRGQGGAATTYGSCPRAPPPAARRPSSRKPAPRPASP
jgi:ABC-type enterobactin transport system permease subunit